MDKEIGWLLKEKYLGKLTEQFKKDVERLKKGEPVGYVIGFAEFLGCKIDLSKNPLIPRPETEFWVGKVIEKLKIVNSLKIVNCKLKIRCLDIFAGSGCIGIAVLVHVPNLLLAHRSLGEVGCDFTDIDENNLSQIKVNCKINGIDSKKYRVIQSDVFLNIIGKYDYIFANPPYIPTKNKNKIQRSVLKYEPGKALFGGADGLFYVKKLLKDAKSHLNPEGRIYMEFDPPQKKELEKLIKKYSYKSYKFYRDQYGRCRWVMIK